MSEIGGFSEKQSKFEMEFKAFVGDQLLFNNPTDNIFELAKAMVFQTTHPKNTFQFMSLIKENVIDDIKRLSR